MTTEQIELRPEVKRFAELMEMRLRDHDGAKGPKGWANASSGTLVELLHTELGEFHSALLNTKGRAGLDAFHHVQATAREAADAANYLMMVIDVLGGLRG